MEGQHRKSWLAAYTRSCHERHVADQLQSKSLEFLLPTYERSVRWSDRIKCCPAPLFPGYLSNNPRFLWQIGLQLAGLKNFPLKNEVPLEGSSLTTTISV